jgi:hypothetical protein
MLPASRLTARAHGVSLARTVIDESCCVVPLEASSRRACQEQERRTTRSATSVCVEARATGGVAKSIVADTLSTGIKTSGPGESLAAGRSPGAAAAMPLFE